MKGVKITSYTINTTAIDKENWIVKVDQENS